MRIAKRSFVPRRAQGSRGIAMWSTSVSFDARAIEAELNRLRRQAGRIFHAVQALFFDGSDQLAVHHNRSGGIRVIRIDPKNDHRNWKLSP